MQDSEKRIWHDIVTRCYKAFTKERSAVEFSDEWWKDLIADFDDIKKLYNNTKYSPFVNELTMKMLDQHERRQKEWQTQ